MGERRDKIKKCIMCVEILGRKAVQLVRTRKVQILNSEGPRGRLKTGKEKFVELTMLSIAKIISLIGTMSSRTRHRFSLYQVHCRAQIDKIFYSVVYWFSLHYSHHLMAAFELWRSEIFWKINLHQTVEIQKKNLDPRKIYSVGGKGKD